jgi:protein-arginine kinase activator protein McsA
MIEALVHCEMHEEAASMRSKVEALRQKVENKVIHE